MGSPHRSELEARALIAERARELRRIDESTWREQAPPDARRRGTARRTLGGWLMRAGAWIAGTPVGPTGPIHPPEPCSSVPS